MQNIYKIITPQEWQKFQHAKKFYGNPMDLKSGFIHCSQESQYPRIKEKFFNDQSPLILLLIDINKLPEDALKIETNRPGGDEYPHVYVPLPLNAVVAWKTLE